MIAVKASTEPRSTVNLQTKLRLKKKIKIKDLKFLWEVLIKSQTEI